MRSITALLLALLYSGCDATAPSTNHDLGTGVDAGRDGGMDAGLALPDAGPPPDAGSDAGVGHCDAWANWSCQEASGMCIATCRSDAGFQQVACDTVKCARATSTTSSEVCPPLDLPEAKGCSSCQKAFESGCR